MDLPRTLPDDLRVHGLDSLYHHRAPLCQAVPQQAQMVRLTTEEGLGEADPPIEVHQLLGVDEAQRERLVAAVACAAGTVIKAGAVMMPYIPQIEVRKRELEKSSKSPTRADLDSR